MHQPWMQCFNVMALCNYDNSDDDDDMNRWWHRNMAHHMAEVASLEAGSLVVAEWLEEGQAVA